MWLEVVEGGMAWRVKWLFPEIEHSKFRKKVVDSKKGRKNREKRVKLDRTWRMKIGKFKFKTCYRSRILMGMREKREIYMIKRWCKESVPYLCRSRKSFLSSKIYTKMKKMAAKKTMTGTFGCFGTLTWATWHETFLWTVFICAIQIGWVKNIQKSRWGHIYI